MSSAPSNPNQKHYKFIFQANIKTVSLALKFPCVVSILWKRGQKAQQIKQRKPIQKGIINFNQTLQIQCNMMFDVNKKTFEQKKTKFTILIFSQKGNKQAGQVCVDVAQLLNSKSKILQLQKSLQKCPDKNAKLKLSLSGYMKQQITVDMISQKSQKTYDIQANLNSTTPTIQPDFKKKKNQAPTVGEKVNNQKVLSLPISNKLSQLPLSQNSQKFKVALSKQNMSRVKLQEQNSILKDELKQLRQLEIQNQNLKRKYQEADKKAESYYRKKYQEMKEQLNQFKQKNQQVTSLMSKRQQLQLAICECKQTIGKIFNYAIMSENYKLMEMMERYQ